MSTSRFHPEVQRSSSQNDLLLEETARELDQLERWWTGDHARSRRIRRLERARRCTEVAVFASLVLSVVLLTIAMGMQSMLAGGLGVSAYLATFVFDRRYQRMRDEMSWPAPEGSASH